MARGAPPDDSPESSQERSPKRRRLSHTTDDSSSDELSRLSPNPLSLRREYQSSSTRPNDETRSSSPPIPPPPSYDPIADDSADELDHTYLQVPKSRFHPNTTAATASVSSGIESEDTDQASSPVPSHAETAPESQSYHRLNYRPKLIIRGHKRAISAVKFSPNGKWIASCSADATLRIHAYPSGAHHHTFHGHLAGISTLSWSPDSLTIATGSDDKSIRLWSLSTLSAHPRALTGHHNYVYTVCFSPKGNMLASGSYDEAVFLWDVRAGRLMRSLPAHGDPVGGVDFVRDGTLIVSCATDGLIRVWDTLTGQCLRTFFHEDTPPVSSVRFSPNGKYILAWMLDSSVRMWNYVDGRCVKTYQGHENRRFSVTGAFGSYSERAVRGDGGRMLRRASHEDADGDDHDTHGDVPEPEPAVRAFIASGGEDGAITIWDVISKEILQRLEGFSEDVGGEGGDAIKTDTSELATDRARRGHAGPVFCVDVHPTDRTLVSCGQDRTVRIWRAVDTA